MLTSRIISVAALCSASSLTATVLGDVNSDVTVDAKSTVLATIAITIDSLFGVQTDVDSAVVTVDGGGAIVLGPGAEPFSSMGIDSMQFLLGDATLSYEFFCAPIFGCQEIIVAAQNLTLNLLESTSTSIASDGVATFDATWNMTVDYQISGDIFELSGSTEQAELIVFECDVDAANGFVTMDSLFLGDIHASISPDKLPVGVYGVELLVSFDLAETSMSGEYEGDPGVPGDLNGDGIVNGADLGLLLAQWGSTGTADLNGDGVVNGADLGLMLAAWG
jgi:hypothetical protein